MCCVVLCVAYVTVVDSWVGGYPPKQLLKGKQWDNQSVSYIKSKLLEVKSLPNLRLLTLCNVKNFNIFFLKEVETQV